MASNSAYGAAAAEVAELFADYLEGDASRPALTLSQGALDPAARNAVERSLESFGYPQDACTFATLLPENAAAEGGDILLDPQALFLLVEGLDPLLVIAADSAAGAALGKAYRAAYPTDAAARIFGRPGAVFQDLGELMKSEAGKQKAWSILKTLNQ